MEVYVRLGGVDEPFELKVLSALKVLALSLRHQPKRGSLQISDTSETQEKASNHLPISNMNSAFMSGTFSSPKFGKLGQSLSRIRRISKEIIR